MQLFGSMEPGLWAQVDRGRRALDLLVKAYLPYAEGWVKQLAHRRSMPHAELQGAAADGIMRAARRYDAARGVPFDAFARQHVFGAALDLARKNDSRKVEHGKRPRYHVARLAGDAVAAPTSEARELAAAILAAISGDVRREVFVRCALAREAAYDVALSLGTTSAVVKRELAAAREEAGHACEEIGLPVPKDCKPQSSLPRRVKPTFPAEDLLILAASLLAPDGRQLSPDEGDVLHAQCQCGVMVTGPRAPRGPLPGECPACGAAVEFR